MINPCNYQGPGNNFLYHVIQSGTKFVQMERESETRFSYQSERSTYGRGSVPNGTENLIFGLKIRIEFG